MKRIIFLTSFLIILSNVISYSQDAKPQIADSLKHADIIRLLTAMGSVYIANQVLDESIKQMKQFLPDVAQDYWTKLKGMNDTMEMLEMNAAIFDQYFSYDEIKELIKFYESPIGVKFTMSIGEISEQMFQVEDTWREKINKTMYEQLKEDDYIKVEEGKSE